MKRFNRAMATLMIVASLTSGTTAFAGTSSTSAGTYGTLKGTTTGYTNVFSVETTSTKASNLCMSYSLQHNSTGVSVSPPAALFTTHRIYGTSYVVYTSATANIDK